LVPFGKIKQSASVFNDYSIAQGRIQQMRRATSGAIRRPTISVMIWFSNDQSALCGRRNCHHLVKIMLARAPPNEQQ
jgi:hypothetical protein